MIFLSNVQAVKNYTFTITIYFPIKAANNARFTGAQDAK